MVKPKPNANSRFKEVATPESNKARVVEARKLIMDARTISRLKAGSKDYSTMQNTPKIAKETTAQLNAIAYVQKIKRKPTE